MLQKGTNIIKSSSNVDRSTTIEQPVKEQQIIIQNIKQDVTDFRHVHPGGADLFLPLLGTDCTEKFFKRHTPDVLLQIKHLQFKEESLREDGDSSDAETASSDEAGSRSRLRRRNEVPSVTDIALKIAQEHTYQFNNTIPNLWVFSNAVQHVNQVYKTTPINSLAHLTDSQEEDDYDDNASQYSHQYDFAKNYNE